MPQMVKVFFYRLLLNFGIMIRKAKAFGILIIQGLVHIGHVHLQNIVITSLVSLKKC